jgi:tight adherence protein B
MQMLTWLAISLLGGGAVALFVWATGPLVMQIYRRQVERYDRVLNHELLLGIQPAVAVVGSLVLVVVVAGFAYVIGGSWPWLLIGAGIGAVLPHLLVHHTEQKRRARLETQLVDAIISLASAVRAGLNLVQAMGVLVQNQSGPVRQEFEHLLREYELGIDLNRAMRNAADRIGSSNYRLLFAAIEAHRKRGGDLAQSLDRIAESIREIQRLEGRLETLTAQGRAQARMMAAMPVVILVLMFFILEEETRQLFVDPSGRLLLVIAGALIAAGFVWIRRIMSVEI